LGHRSLDTVVRLRDFHNVKPTAIDLFSGCGGLTLGLKQAGFKVVGAVEIDPLAVETYQHNHPEVFLWSQDIRKIAAPQILKALGLKRGQLDLLAGCPPCQGFSSMRRLNGSTARIIDVANRWAETIGAVKSMQTPDMKHGNKLRTDHHASHVALIGFPERLDEAKWIAEAIREIVPTEAQGALHDKRDGKHRGLALSDVAILVRSASDVRTYMKTLEEAGIPSVVRAGPDLFSQPEVLFFVGALGLSAGIEEFYGSSIGNKSIPKRVAAVLQCEPKPSAVLRAAARQLRS